MLTIGTYDIPSGTKVWIEDVVVDESQRGKGIGKELTLFAIGFAKSLGADSVELTSRPSRESLQTNYIKSWDLFFVKQMYTDILSNRSNRLLNLKPELT